MTTGRTEIFLPLPLSQPVAVGAVDGLISRIVPEAQITS
jgi:hypothetical protein